MNANAARRRIGVVFQSYNLFPHMTVLDNVSLAPRRVHGTREARGRGAGLRAARPARAGGQGRRLSGPALRRPAAAHGHRPRAGHEPELLLLDEITAALDPELVGEVLDVVSDLKEPGMTILMATHEMGFARHAADRVCYLEDGVIREQGSAEQVLGDPQHASTRRFLSRVLDHRGTATI